MNKYITACVALGLAVSFRGGALADCAPLRMITTVDLTPATDGLAEFVPTKINGTPELMLLDTGGANDEITPETANALQLKQRVGNIIQYDVSGNHSDHFASASLEIGTLKADEAAFIVSPGDIFGTGSKIAGILGPNILQNYDVHIDFGANKLTLLSPDHCDGKVIYWPASTVSVLPIRVLKSGHILVPVLLDGRPVTAMLDTGAYNTTLSIPVAEGDFGLKLGSPDTPFSDVKLERPGAYTYKHVFKTLALEGITIGNPHIDIIPDELDSKIANTPDLGTRLADRSKDDDKADMLLGMNVLRHFHLYIAYKEQKLYIAPIEAPSAAPNSP